MPKSCVWNSLLNTVFLAFENRLQKKSKNKHIPKILNRDFKVITI